MADHEEIIKVLEGAKTAIIEDGWGQGGFHPSDGEGGYTHCALGALQVGAGLWINGANIYAATSGLKRSNNMRVARDAVAGVLTKELGIQCPDIGVWNDSPFRSEAEVLEVLDQAIIFVKDNHRG